MRDWRSGSSHRNRVKGTPCLHCDVFMGSLPFHHCKARKKRGWACGGVREEALVLTDKCLYSLYEYQLIVVYVAGESKVIGKECQGGCTEQEGRLSESW